MKSTKLEYTKNEVETHLSYDEKVQFNNLLEKMAGKKAGFLSEDLGDNLIRIEEIIWMALNEDGLVLVNLVNGETAVTSIYSIIWI